MLPVQPISDVLYKLVPPATKQDYSKSCINYLATRSFVLEVSDLPALLVFHGPDCLIALLSHQYCLKIDPTFYLIKAPHVSNLSLLLLVLHGPDCQSHFLIAHLS